MVDTLSLGALGAAGVAFFAAEASSLPAGFWGDVVSNSNLLSCCCGCLWTSSAASALPPSGFGALLFSGGTGGGTAAGAAALSVVLVTMVSVEVCRRPCVGMEFHCEERNGGRRYWGPSLGFRPLKRSNSEEKIVTSINFE